VGGAPSTRRCGTPFDIGSHRVFTSASIGITLSSRNGTSVPRTICATADTAMYRAKNRRGGRAISSSTAGLHEAGDGAAQRRGGPCGAPSER